MSIRVLVYSCTIDILCCYVFFSYKSLTFQLIDLKLKSRLEWLCLIVVESLQYTSLLCFWAKSTQPGLLCHSNINETIHRQRGIHFAKTKPVGYSTVVPAANCYLMHSACSSNTICNVTCRIELHQQLRMLISFMHLPNTWNQSEWSAISATFWIANRIIVV